MLNPVVSLLRDHSRRLEEHIQLVMGAENVEVPGTELHEVLSRVRTKLSGNRIARDADLRVILNHLVANSSMELANRLRQALEVYDFQKALALLDDVSTEA